MRRSTRWGGLLAVSLLPTCFRPALADERDEFFEAQIRPVLVEQCYRCHNSSKLAEGGLAVDQRAALLKGGDQGAIIVPGKPAESRLLAILRHEVDGLKMPRDGARLDKSVIANFEKWIALGAPDPRDKPPSADALARETSWEAIRERRKKWWSLQPVRRVDPPAVGNAGWLDHPVDRFVWEKLEEHGLQPAPRADKHTLLRRATFALTGLPPTSAETVAFLADASPNAYENLLDRLLASPRFGERWARHWMDLVRYCESHGSQGDPELPNAWRYRDYLIRAFNSDVPYDQFVREHLAGDLLPQPRVHPAEELNESALGTAHLRMGEFGYIPVDALDDQVKVVDNQIDVFSKAFLALTVSCARCHDHKFDAISQQDYYALYGVFASCRPGQILIDTPSRLAKHRDELGRLKEQIRGELSDAWQAAVPKIVAAMKQQAQGETEQMELQRREQQLLTDIAAIERPAQAALWKARGRQVAASLPIPWARWSFTEDARDAVGGLHGTLEGNASFRDGRLVFNGQDVRVRTGPLPKEISEKTLEAWVSLANLDQRGTGVITVESDDGAQFDSIVFSEMDPRVWLAGSDFFQRTQVPGGPAEQAGPTQLIHMAIVYRRDNSITLYRDGQPYGSTYTKGTLHTFAAGKSRVMFGQRHPAPGISFLAGEIDEARLYDRPLTAAEVAASFQAGPAGVSRQDLLQSLPVDEARRLTALYDEQAELRRRLKTLEDANAKWRSAFTDARKNAANPLHAWTQLTSLSSQQMPEAWHKLAADCEQDLDRRRAFNQQHFQPGWDLSRGDHAHWFAAGTGLSGPSSSEAPFSRGGQFAVENEGDRVLRGIYPAGILTHGLSRKYNGVLTSPRFVITTDSVSIRAFGEHSRARLVIENYALGNGGLYPATRLGRDDIGWTRLDTSYRKGSHAYVEFATDDNDRAYFGAGQVVFHDGATAPQEVVVPIRYVLQAAAPASAEALAERYAATLLGAIASFRANDMTADEVAFLDYFVRGELLPVSVAQLPTLGALVEEYRQREREIPTPRRAPGVHEAMAFDQPLFVRGRHTQPAEPVARRFLEALGGTPYHGSQTGRLQLAREVSSPDNPLTARVLVNRLWHHVFGKGLVGTVDNFGRLGDVPTHPELLDYLAARFVADEQWSIKKMLRLLMTSQTYQQAAVASEAAKQLDGNNDWLSHMRVRRLEAEAIRDAILSCSGQLDPTMYGPGVDVYFVNKTEGGGPKGPLDGARRRSIYQRIRRNAHNPFLEVFDAPKPSTTRGKRDVTNVPAQSLALLNDPFVIDQAAKWAVTLVRDGADREQRVRGMFVVTLGREPNAAELAASLDYLTELAAEHGVPVAEIPSSTAVWQDFAQTVFCLKEFIYVH